jgi:hypothetical protein
MKTWMNVYKSVEGMYWKEHQQNWHWTFITMVVSVKKILNLNESGRNVETNNTKEKVDALWIHGG